MQSGADTLEDSLVGFFPKASSSFPYDQAILLLGFCAELKIYVYTKVCTWIFIAALFIIAKT